MFDNAIDITEPLSLLRRFRRDALLREKLFRKIRFLPGGRVSASWSHTVSPPVNWWDVPMVQERWNRMISGKEHLTHQRYFAATHAAGRRRLKGLSLGCGAGAKEVAWARTGIFSSIDAYDISEPRIRAAIAAAEKTREASIVHYHAADVLTMDQPGERFDVVIFEHSLHHFTPLNTLLPRLHDLLVPGGLLVANEFIGPTRFQWTARQLSAVNALLDLLPTNFATYYGSRFRKLPVVRPSRFAAWLSDPSEAVESSNIVPSLRKHFTVVDFRGYGGGVLHLLLAGIAHHFVNPGPEGRRLLELCFAVEDLLLDVYEVDHDFAFIVCRRLR